MMKMDYSFDEMFSGIIGQEYQMLKLICPTAAEMSRLVGEAVAECCHTKPQKQFVVELGGGTGITTLSILSADEHLEVLSVDNEPTMQNQAKSNLQEWASAGRLKFWAEDALSALKKMEADSVDVVASAYTLHNFEADYREQVLLQIFRVLKPEGRFINGDRYALDDVGTHTRNTQHEIAGYFKVLTEIHRLDLLEHWIIHLFSDESENRIMRESVAMQQLIAAGFKQIQFKMRKDANALMIAVK